MHKFMRTIGFGGCDSDLEMDKIMRKLAKTASKTAVLERNDHPTLYDLRAELAPGMGIAMIGQMTEKGTFKREYAFPYVTGSDISSTAEEKSSGQSTSEIDSCWTTSFQSCTVCPNPCKRTVFIKHLLSSR
mgnify:FL=1